jgi:peroxiredoxin
MKIIKNLALVIFVLMAGVSFSQDNIQGCVKDIFLREDSTLNHADRFMLWQECVKGKDLPEFSMKTLNGDKIKSKSLKGKIVVINLWFIDCLPCIKELPALNKLVAANKDHKDVIFLAVTWESKERIEKEFLARYDLDFQVVPEAMDVVDLFGKPGYPSTFVIGKDGKVKAAWLGGPIDDAAETEAYKRVQPVLDELRAR